MNSLNIISARVSPSPSPSPTRTNSLAHLGLAVPSDEGDDPTDGGALKEDQAKNSPESDDYRSQSYDHHDYMNSPDEKTPLLGDSDTKDSNIRSHPWHVLPARIVTNLINSIRWVLSTIAAPGVYLIACLYDEQGNFAPLRQLRSLFGAHGNDSRKYSTSHHRNVSLREKDDSSRRANHSAKGKHAFTAAMQSTLSSGTSSSGLSSESESDMVSRSESNNARTSGSSNRHARSKSLQPSEEIAPARRSIRIKLHSDDALRQRKHRKAQSASAKAAGGDPSAELSAQLKSPTSPVGALTKYPKTPAPPRPLIPRRQPSYIPYDNPDPAHLKTLILDLDETLIHSMSKGGRMGSGHMVEVRLNTTYVGAGGSQSLGPQHPILYFVHKRPHCDEFLRKISKWYNLVVFTASVQEYADPVIDWLESERKYFSGRLYRQHCTFRHGAFIKDLSSVEPDLSKVMILDNSPLSYMFHQDNAIPIQGWISDPTDNDLLHLVPLLEGLQYVSDVRALLALRGGEDS